MFKKIANSFLCRIYMGSYEVEISKTGDILSRAKSPVYLVYKHGRETVKFVANNYEEREKIAKFVREKFIAGAVSHVTANDYMHFDRKKDIVQHRVVLERVWNVGEIITGAKKCIERLE